MVRVHPGAPTIFASVAQWDRARGYGPRGWEIVSLQMRHFGRVV